MPDKEILEKFVWAPGIVLEMLPASEPVMKTFDSGLALGIAWKLPSGKRYSVLLQHMKCIGGEFASNGGWTIEPDGYILTTVTKTGLRNAVKKSLEPA